MLTITIINYPEGATSSSIELVPEAQLPGLVDDYWVSEKPLPEPHIFSIDPSFYPLRISLFIVQKDYEEVYWFQGTHPEDANYLLVNLPAPASYTFDVGAEALYMETREANWIPTIIAIMVMGIAVHFTIEGTRRKK